MQWAKHMVKGGLGTCVVWRFVQCTLLHQVWGRARSNCALSFSIFCLWIWCLHLMTDNSIFFSHLSEILGSQSCFFFKECNNGYLRKMTPVIEFLDRQAKPMSEGLFNPRFQGFWRCHSPLILSWWLFGLWINSPVMGVWVGTERKSHNSQNSLIILWIKLDFFLKIPI